MIVVWNLGLMQKILSHVDVMYVMRYIKKKGTLKKTKHIESVKRINRDRRNLKISHDKMIGKCIGKTYGFRVY